MSYPDSLMVENNGFLPRENELSDKKRKKMWQADFTGKLSAAKVVSIVVLQVFSLFKYDYFFIMFFWHA